MAKIRMLYCMNTSWGWIKQRPHFLAEGLSGEYDITVVTKKTKHNTKSENSNVTCKTLYRLPFERIGIIATVNKILYRLQFRSLAKSADIIWIASPNDFSFAFKSCENKIVIYDCMDDQIELQKNQKRKKEISIWEKKLFNRADIIIASSYYLSQVLSSRYGKKNIVVVNNAIKDNFGNEAPVNEKNTVSYDMNYTHLSYIGTISTWIDFALIKALINKFPNIVFHFYGPIDCKTYPTHERMVFHGPVPHNQVKGVMETADILVMPFIVNELIKSVNPVKLYEYIYTGKPCIAPLYGESKPFEEYVYLYKDSSECIELIEELITNGRKPKKKMEECREFTKNNTWSARVRSIISIITSYIKENNVKM